MSYCWIAFCDEQTSLDRHHDVPIHLNFDYFFPEQIVQTFQENHQYFEAKWMLVKKFIRLHNIWLTFVILMWKWFQYLCLLLTIEDSLDTNAQITIWHITFWRSFWKKNVLKHVKRTNEKLAEAYLDIPSNIRSFLIEKFGQISGNAKIIRIWRNRMNIKVKGYKTKRKQRISKYEWHMQFSPISHVLSS